MGYGRAMSYSAKNRDFQLSEFIKDTDYWGKNTIKLKLGLYRNI